MTIARFSPFELLLLKSRHQADTAALLLLAWVLANRGPIGEPERSRLTELTGGFRHGHALAPILEIAATQDLGAIQLAAEVLQKEIHGEQASPFLRLAIALAVEDGKLSMANQHVLRFLADLLGVSPGEFAPLFEAVAGRAFADPDDPSRSGYWQAKEHRRRQREQESQRQDDRQHSRSHSGREGSHRRKEEESKWQQAGGREQHRQERYRQEQHRQHERGARQDPPPGDRTRRALAVLGLEPGASRSEIRHAYRRLAQAHHPDRFFNAGEAVMASASQRFQRIRRAYDYLMQVS
ncbi:DnaJ domain-containing protein [Halomonas sp. LBP4]|uniref:DnaJ domain-containing protein n=1 Tax=Halomonas sp. LBP4 TaxID=2044917 RepID=UPI000D76AA32|nr:DnaJ domain-containing protein [Halomonas sp. LBP4]PXX98672.1 molecular chaperone DnaJ [Halomonas sp. LBP4]